MRVPRFLAPLARRIRDAERLIEKGIVVDSPSVKSNRQKDGRVQLGCGNERVFSAHSQA